MRSGADHELQECFRCTQRRWNQNGDLVAFTVENLQHNNCPRTLRSLMSTTFRCWILYCGRPKKYCYKEEMLSVSMQWSNVFYCRSNRVKWRREHEMLPCWAATSAIENRKGRRMRVSYIRCFWTFGHHCHARNAVVLEYRGIPQAHGSRLWPVA